MTDTWVEIVKVADAPMVLLGAGLAIRWLTRKLDAREKDLKDLNSYIRANDKENLGVLKSLQTLISEIKIDVTSSKEDIPGKVIGELKDVEQRLSERITNITNYSSHG